MYILIAIAITNIFIIVQVHAGRRPDYLDGALRIVTTSFSCIVIISALKTLVLELWLEL